MHKLESLALSCGSKIHKPHIYKSYYPLVEDNFICVSQNSPSLSRRYDLFNDVIFHIKPFLDQAGITIIEILEQDFNPLFYCKPYDQLNQPQVNYIISKSKLYFGNFNFNAHVASAFSIPCVTPVNNSYIDLEKPYWSKDSFQIITPKIDSLPSFNDKEYPKTINSINPESIACAILDNLNIDHNLNKLKTIFVGPEYNSSIIDIVPGSYAVNESNTPDNSNIRMDKNYDLIFLAQCANIKPFNVITNKSIPKDVLNTISNKLKGITFFVDKNTKLEELKEMELAGKPINIVTRDSKNIAKIRLNFIDYPVRKLASLNKKSLNNGKYDDLKFLSKRNIIFNGSAFNSYHSIKKGNNTSVAEYSKEFLEDLPFCRVYKETT